MTRTKKLKKYYTSVLVIVAIFFLVLNPVFGIEGASENTTSQETQTVVSPTKGIRKEFNQKEKEVRLDIKDSKSQLKNDLKSITNTALDLKRDKRLANKIASSEAQQRIRSQFKDKIKELELKRKELREEFKEKREEFKLKLTELRDEKKKQLLERVDKKMSELNKKITDHWLKKLGDLNTRLSNLQQRADQAKANGVDTSTVTPLIQNAQAAITTAQTAISTQAGKDYVAEITDETTLRNTVGVAHKTMETDLKTVRQSIVAAREAIIKVAQELQRLKIDFKLQNLPNKPDGSATESAQ